MKNIEKIAIDSLVEKFTTEKQEIVQNLIAAKAAAELAQHNFKKAAGPVLTCAKELGAMLIADEISPEAANYFEQKMTDIVKIPFTIAIRTSDK